MLRENPHHSELDAGERTIAGCFECAFRAVPHTDLNTLYMCVW